MLKTLNQALEILNLFTQEHTRWTSKEISQKLGIPVINVYRILETFVANDYLRKDLDSKQYEIGPSLTIFSYLAFQKYDVYTMIHPYLEDLMKETGEAIYLIKSDRTSAANIDVALPENRISLSLSLNKKLPLYVGASYWAILAFLPQETIDSVINAPFKKLLDPKKLTPDLLLNQLDHVRKYGWCSSSEITTPDVVSISSPIFYKKQVVGSITITKPIFRLHETDVEQLGILVKSYAGKISAVLDKNKVNLNAYSFFRKKVNNIF